MGKGLAKGFRNVLLAGLPATGKSTFGRAYAAFSGRQFLDFDAFVETVAGRTIPEIFAKEGEEGFRALEKKAIGLLEKKSRTVIALGGGTLCSDENAQALRGLGLLAFLSTPLDVVAERIALARERNPQERPLFQDCADDDAILAKVVELWETRARFYEACDVVLESAFSSVDTLCLQLGHAEHTLLDLQRRPEGIPTSAFLSTDGVKEPSGGRSWALMPPSRATIQREIVARLPSGGRPQRSSKGPREKDHKDRDERTRRKEGEGLAPRSPHVERGEPLRREGRLPRLSKDMQSGVQQDGREVRLPREGKSEGFARGPRPEHGAPRGPRPEHGAPRGPRPEQGRVVRDNRNNRNPRDVSPPRKLDARPPREILTKSDNNPPRENASPRETPAPLAPKVPPKSDV